MSCSTRSAFCCTRRRRGGNPERRFRRRQSQVVMASLLARVPCLDRHLLGSAPDRRSASRSRIRPRNYRCSYGAASRTEDGLAIWPPADQTWFMAGARFGSVNVIVEDVDALARFLDSLGLALEPTPSEWAAHHRSYTADDAGFEAEFDTPAFARWWGAVPREGAPQVVVNVHVDSREAVDELHRHALDLGAEELKAPWDAFWGARYSVVITPGHFSWGS